jgi:hypothetical protein
MCKRFPEELLADAAPAIDAADIAPATLRKFLRFQICTGSPNAEVFPPHITIHSQGQVNFQERFKAKTGSTFRI